MWFRNDKADDSPSGFQERVLPATRRLLRIYPESALVDIYKSFFQDEFGPGHLLDDLASARGYFDNELSTMVSSHRYDNEPCGVGCHFYRASLEAVVDGLIDADQFFSAFVAGSAEFRLPELSTWKHTWNTILASIQPLQHQIADFNNDALEISCQLDHGNCVMSHSNRYRTRYAPHYRIMKLSGTLTELPEQLVSGGNMQAPDHAMVTE